MARGVLYDWTRLLLTGLLIGLGLLGVSAGWVWYNGEILSLYALETPLFILGAIALVIGGTASRPTRAVYKDPNFALLDSHTERSEDRRARMSFGIYLVTGGAWVLILVFLLDWLRR